MHAQYSFNYFNTRIGRWENAETWCFHYTSLFAERIDSNQGKWRFVSFDDVSGSYHLELLHRGNLEFTDGSEYR
jgi:hypothetical protein